MTQHEAAIQNQLGARQSLWLATTSAPRYPQLSQELHVDVAIVGAGIAGLTAAFLLKQMGAKVAVLEACGIVEGVTANTTAKLTSLHTLTYADLKQQKGPDAARTYAEANEAGIHKIEELIGQLGIECDFQHLPAYTYTESTDEVDTIREEADAAREAGLAAQFVTETPLPFPVAAAVRVDNQAFFHPRAYLLALAEQIPGNGSYLFERTKALDISGEEPCTITTEQGKVLADDVVIATHYPFIDNALYFARMSAHMSYSMAVKLDEPAPHGMFISTDAQRTLRPHVLDGEELLLVGGKGHKTGHVEDTDALNRDIVEWAQRHFAVNSIRYRWATQDYGAMDGVPYIGLATPASRHVYVATGFKGWGMSNGTASGMILSDLIMDRPNPWADLFNPNRVDMDSVGKIAKQSVHVAKTFVTERLESAKEIEPLQPGQGMIVETKSGKEAYYRDDDASLHRLSPVCPHMGCILAWNPAEKSWDCPCHASRFTATGEVFDGPALHDMKPAD